MGLVALVVVVADDDDFFFFATLKLKMSSMALPVLLPLLVAVAVAVLLVAALVPVPKISFMYKSAVDRFFLLSPLAEAAAAVVVVDIVVDDDAFFDFLFDIVVVASAIADAFDFFKQDFDVLALVEVAAVAVVAVALVAGVFFICWSNDWTDAVF